MDFVETVRCAIELDGKILLLKKSKDSKFPSGYELPGGKSEQVNKLSYEESWELIKKEVKEETDIDITPDISSLEPFEFMYAFNINGEEYKRKVKCYYARLLKPQEVKLNNIPGEDHHESFIWVSIKGISEFVKNNKISPNSLEFLKFISEEYTKSVRD